MSESSIRKQSEENEQNRIYREYVENLSKNTYIFQTKDCHPYQCGPIVIYNVLVKLDKYKELDKLIEYLFL